MMMQIINDKGVTMRRMVFLAMTLLMVASCGKPVGLTGNAVVATVGDETITAAELDEKADAQLKRLQGEIFKIKQGVLDQLIDEKLVKQAAKKAGVSVDDFMKKEVADKITPPTDAEMQGLYDSHKGKDTKPFAELKPQIQAYMMRSQEMQARNELMSKLRKEAGVKVYLEPPRVVVSGIDNAPSIGPKDAKVTIVDFSDYQCPFSGRARPTVDRVIKNYSDKVRYVFMDFPLGFHKNAPKAHEAAHCAGDQGKYFEYSKKLFDNHNNMEISDLKKYAKETGIDAAKFDKCLDSGEHAADVQKSMQAGVAAGVNGTPAFFINGILISGAQPYEAFVEVIDAELNR